jgi:TRAP-type C4-dicarboxylate transport system permease small subunit
MKKMKYLLIPVLAIFLIPTIVLAGDWGNLINMDELWQLATQSVQGLIGGLLSIVSIVFILLFIFAGTRIMMSAGNPDDMKKAKALMLFAVLGLILLLASNAIYDFIAGMFE